MRAQTEIAGDVRRGLALSARIATDKETLAEIEARLKQDGLDRPDEHGPLDDDEREGRQWLAAGIVPVVFTADLLVKTFQADTVIEKRIRAAAGHRFPKFFAPARGYVTVQKDGKKFRALADEFMGEDAPKFIAACRALDKQGLPKNAVKVLWSAETEEEE